MPTITRVMIRLALLYLVVAMVLWTGGPLVAQATSVPVMLGARAAWHLLVVGWLTQLIFAVAYWLFPTHKAEPKRGPVTLAWIGTALLNVGLLLRLVFEPLRGFYTAAANLGLTLSAVAQVVGVVVWTAVMWPRVKGK